MYETWGHQTCPHGLNLDVSCVTCPTTSSAFPLPLALLTTSLYITPFTTHPSFPTFSPSHVYMHFHDLPLLSCRHLSHRYYPIFSTHLHHFFSRHSVLAHFFFFPPLFTLLLYATMFACPRLAMYLSCDHSPTPPPVSLPLSHLPRLIYH